MTSGSDPAGPGRPRRPARLTPPMMDHFASEALDLAALKTTPAHRLLKGRRADLSPRFATTVVRRIRMVDWEGARIEVAFDAPLHQLAQAFLDRAGAVEDLRLCLAMSISDPLYWLGYHTNFWLSSHEIDAVLYLSW